MIVKKGGYLEWYCDICKKCYHSSFEINEFRRWIRKHKIEHEKDNGGDK